MLLCVYGRKVNELERICEKEGDEVRDRGFSIEIVLIAGWRSSIFEYFS